MAVEIRKASLWDTLRLQWFVSIPAFLSGLVVPNRWFLSWRCGHGAGASTMRFLAGLRDKYRCEHLWVWFPVRRTLLALAPQTIEAVLRSDANAADPALKKRALSRFVPDSLVISSGEEWRDRRRFNEAVLDTSAPLHRHHDAFGEIVAKEVEQWIGPRGGELRWPEFQALAQRLSQQIILGAGQCRDDMNDELAHMSSRSNILLRDEGAFASFYATIDRDLAQRSGAPSACLMHDSAARIAEGDTSAATRVPGQIGFWLFVLKDALELHVARTLALIAAHPDVQQRVREEVRAPATLSAAAIVGLPYLKACLHEQLRLWTPVPLLMRRALHSFSLRNEIAIEEDEQILIHAGFYHRDPRVFGAAADTFSPAAAVNGMPDTYFFSAHRQACAGRPLVTFLAGATLASLLRRFRFELAGPAIDPRRIAYRYDHFKLELRAVPQA